MESNNRRRRANPPKGPRRRVVPPRQLIPHPPPIQNFGITHATRLRFITNANIANASITFQNLLDCLNVAASAVTAFQLFQRVKVRRVSIWAVPVVGNATTVQLEFAGATAGIAGDAKIHTDTSMGIEPACVIASPSVRSQAANFQLGGATPAFELTCPSGAVIDVELTYQGLPGVGNATTNAPAAATVGAWYYRGLDGLAAAATAFVPVINSSGTD